MYSLTVTETENTIQLNVSKPETKIIFRMKN